MGVTKLPRAAFPGAWRLGERLQQPRSTQVPLAQAHAWVLVTAAATTLSMEGGNFHQASPAGSPGATGPATALV